MGFRREAEAREMANDRKRAIAECMTPLDNWGGKELEYIDYLMRCPSSRWVDIDGERTLITLRGFDSIDSHFDAYNDETSYSYNHAVGRGYFGFEMEVKELYLKLRQSGKLKDIDKAKLEREENEWWELYYEQYPQFKPR
jgi:hypothetical protein